MGGSAYDNTNYSDYLRKAMENEANLSKPKYPEDEAPEPYLKRFLAIPPTRLGLELDEYLTDFKKRVQERLDAVCHQALSEGKHGVKVVTNTGDGTIMFEISEEVPLGEIHYHTEHGPAAWFGPY